MSDTDQKSAYAAVRAKFPRGKVCPNCGHLMDVSRYRIIGKVVPNKTPRLCPYCIECEADRTKKRNEDRRSKAKAGLPRAKPLESFEIRKPLPVLKVGGRYRIIDSGKTWEGFDSRNGRQRVKVYEGITIRRMDGAGRPIRWEFRYRLGNTDIEKTTCFNQGQLVPYTIIPIGEGLA